MSQSETDCFRIGRHEMFGVLRDNLPENRSETQNIVECKDDVLFVWNPVECCLLSLNWRAAYTKEDQRIKYQRLIPTAPQIFEVDKITASNEGSFLALSGSRGVSILELPRRWGPNGLYQSGKESICCSSHNLDERFFINNSGLEVRQVRWHPASPKDSHLLVLLSNNTIRLYEEHTFRMVWRVGPIPCGLPVSGASPAPYLSGLGDTAVDFDIAPPRVVSSGGGGGGGGIASDDTTMGKNTSIVHNSTAFNETSRSSANVAVNAEATRVEWPLILLRGNGDLYVVLIGIDTEKPQIQGPLVITPSTKNNYGLDYCSILVLPSLPPTIVIAESNGKIHHGLLLDNDCPDESVCEVDASLKINPSEWNVHVLETVVLELGLKGHADAKSNACPIFLKRDMVNESRYFAYHNTGLHAVTVEFILQLQRFVESENDHNPDSSNLLGKSSHAEYVVCTKAIDSNNLNPVLGFALLQSPTGLVLFLASGQVITLSLIADPSSLRELPTPNPSSSNQSSLASKISGQSFELHIKNLLTSKVSQPILQLDKSNEPSPKETLELLMHAAQVLREQYFLKHDRAKNEIEKRVKLLQLLKQQQQQDIRQLQQDKTQIRSNAERLAERYEDIQEKQQSLFRRAQEIVRLEMSANPVSAAAEVEFQQQVERINVVAKRLGENIMQSRRKIINQENQVTSFHTSNKTKSVELHPRQEATIKGLMSELNTDIEAQIKDVKNIRNLTSV